MKQRFLFPHWSRYVGYVCILGHIPMMAVKHMGSSDHSDHTLLHQPETYGDHLYFVCAFLLMVVGLLLVAFSEERIEDEQISRLRLDSLQWAIYVNYAVLIASLLIMNQIENHFMLAADTWIPLLFFIIRFRWAIFRLDQSVKSDH